MEWKVGIVFWTFLAINITIWECFCVTAVLCKQTPPLGLMPNEEIDASDYESVEKYRSYTRYLRKAQETNNKPVWWKTYRNYVEMADPEHGEDSN